MEDFTPHQSDLSSPNRVSVGLTDINSAAVTADSSPVTGVEFPVGESEGSVLHTLAVGNPGRSGSPPQPQLAPPTSPQRDNEDLSSSRPVSPVTVEVDAGNAASAVIANDDLTSSTGSEPTRSPDLPMARPRIQGAHVQAGLQIRVLIAYWIRISAHQFPQEWTRTSRGQLLCR